MEGWNNLERGGIETEDVEEVMLFVEEDEPDEDTLAARFAKGFKFSLDPTSGRPSKSLAASIALEVTFPSLPPPDISLDRIFDLYI